MNSAAAEPTGDEPDDETPALVPLSMPAGGVPGVVEDEHELVAAAAAIAAGSGPVAIDAERASGYRYGQRAYLVQIRREGAGTWLIDPIACTDLRAVAEAIEDVEWVLHAATQDLPCLAEVGLRPTRLFDTELGGRLVGLPRVGLGAVVEHYLGLSLAKEHSAADWSTRPLPEPWLRYAALDVEVLTQIRDAIAADLAAQGKTQWAQEEFDALTRFTGPPPRLEPWRRTSGMHKVRSRRGAATVRELWEARDAIAVARDVSPGRVMADAALVDLAIRAPRSTADLADGPGARSVLRYQRQWLAAIDRARRVSDAELPSLTLRSDGPPPARGWVDREPVKATQLAQTRAALGAVAKERRLPVENLLSPDAMRRVLWSPPAAPSVETIGDALSALGARPWQIAIAAPIMATVMTAPPQRAATGVTAVTQAGAASIVTRE